MFPSRLGILIFLRDEAVASLGADEAGDVKACLVLSVISVILHPALWSAAWSWGEDR